MTIYILIVEPDPARREWLVACLSREVGFRIVGAEEDFLAACRANSRLLRVDVLLVNVDQMAPTALRSWATLHVLWPNARVAALTSSSDALVLESVLGAGVTALHQPIVTPTALCRIVRNASQGIADFDPWLIERARNAVLRPVAETQGRFGGLVIDLQEQVVMCRGRRIHTTPLEFKVLAYLARNAGRMVGIAELLGAVWAAPLKGGGTLAQVHNCIKRLRRKIEPDVKHPTYLCCERGWGYFLQDPTKLRHDLLPIDLRMIDVASPELAIPEN